MRKYLIIVTIIVIVASVFLYLNKQQSNKSTAISDACKMSANIAYAREYIQTCEKLGLHENCQLDNEREVEIMGHRDQYVTACVVNASLDR